MQDQASATAHFASKLLAHYDDGSNSINCMAVMFKHLLVGCLQSEDYADPPPPDAKGNVLRVELTVLGML